MIATLSRTASPGKLETETADDFIVPAGITSLTEATFVGLVVTPEPSTLVLVGSALGLVAAGVVAWSWTHWGRRLNMNAILKVTALFLGLFLIQLLVYGVHELAESGMIHGSQAFHDATERFGPQGDIGHVLSYSLLGAPLLYVLWARLGKKRSPPR